MAQSRIKPTEIDQVRPPVSQSAPQHPLVRWYVDLEGKMQKLEFEDLIRRDAFPLPTPIDREGYLPDHDHYYWVSGHIDWINIQAAVKEFNIQPQPGNKKIRLLDIGCATGRVLRHIHVFGNDEFEVWGSDLAPANVEWVKRYLPASIQVSANLSEPPLQYPDNFFDVVTAFSVIPHIGELEQEWLVELNRVTHQDGLLFLTVGNEATWAASAEREHTIEHFVKSNEIAGNSEFSKATFEQPLPQDRLVRRHTTSDIYNCFTWHSNRYMREQWGDIMQIHRIVDQAHMRYQSVLLASPRQVDDV